MARYGVRSIVRELKWLREIGGGGLFEGSAYKPKLVGELVELGGLVATDAPGLYRIGAITDEMIERAGSPSSAPAKPVDRPE